MRLANTRLELNADGRGQNNGDRVGRLDNGDATIFVRASQPVIVNNEFVDIGRRHCRHQFLSAAEVVDSGRATGGIDALSVVGNSGPLVKATSLDNGLNGLIVRGGQLATAGVMDDVDIVHIVRDAIEVPNKHIHGGLRLESDARGSLVVKFESDENENAGLVIGGSLLSGDQQFVDIADQLVQSANAGHPDFPAVLTTWRMTP